MVRCKTYKRSSISNPPTYSTEGNKHVLSGVDVVVKGPHAPHVGSTINQPGGIKDHSVSQKAWDEVSHPQAFPPEVPRHQCGNDEANHHYRRLIIPKITLMHTFNLSLNFKGTDWKNKHKKQT